MTSTQRHWGIGAGVGGLALVGYEVWKHRKPRGHDGHDGRGHHHHGGDGAAPGGGQAASPVVEVPGENARGEYGHQHQHQHHHHHHHHHQYAHDEEHSRGEY